MRYQSVKTRMRYPSQPLVMESVAFALLVQLCVSFSRNYAHLYILSPDIVTRQVGDALYENIKMCSQDPINTFWTELEEYWKRDFQVKLIEPIIGCLTICAISRLRWLDDESLKRDFHRFAADKETTAKQIKIIRGCYKPSNNTGDADCEPGIEFLDCYRKAMLRLGWAPYPLI